MPLEPWTPNSCKFSSMKCQRSRSNTIIFLVSVLKRTAKRGQDLPAVIRLNAGLINVTKKPQSLTTSSLEEASLTHRDQHIQIFKSYLSATDLNFAHVHRPMWSSFRERLKGQLQIEELRKDSATPVMQQLPIALDAVNTSSRLSHAKS